MINFMRLVFIFMLLGMSSCAHVSAKIPEKYYGDWVMELQYQKGFPWWQQVKYPVSLSINKGVLKFTDQHGNQCELESFVYDDELDMLVFKHCLPTKSSEVITPFYRVKYENDFILGETWGYKALFKWVGKRK